MDEPLVSFDTALLDAVRRHLAEARLDLAPAAVVADVLERRRTSPPVARRRIAVALAAAALATVVAVVIWPELDQLVLPPATTPSPTVAPTPGRTATHVPSPSLSERPATPSTLPTRTARPTTSPPPTQSAQPSPTVVPVVFDGRQALPFQMPAPSLQADTRYSTRAWATSIRSFPLEVQRVVGWQVIDSDRAALTLDTDGGTRATWLVDWAAQAITKLSDRGSAIGPWGSGPDAELLLIERGPETDRIVRLRVGTGEELASVEVPSPAMAVYLTDGSVAVGSGVSIGLWRAGAVDFKRTTIGGIGDEQRLAAGMNVLVGSRLVNPRTGEAVGAALPFVYDSEVSPDGDQIVILTGAGGYAQYSLQVHDATTGDLVTKSEQYLDLVAPGPQILGWVTDTVLVTQNHGFLFGVEPTTRLASSAILINGVDVTSLVPVKSVVASRAGLMLIDGDGFVRLVEWISGTAAPEP